MRALDAECGHHHTLQDKNCGSQIKWIPNNEKQQQQKQQKQ